MTLTTNGWSDKTFLLMTIAAAVLFIIVFQVIASSVTQQNANERTDELLEQLEHADEDREELRRLLKKARSESQAIHSDDLRIIRELRQDQARLIRYLLRRGIPVPEYVNDPLLPREGQG